MSSQGGPTLPQSPINVLSLDGGGVRGLSSLIILRDLMQRLGIAAGMQTPVRPCDCFSLIIGTGTGGISALFLGRMRMTVDQAIAQYVKMAETVFTPSSTSLSPWLSGESSLLDGVVLEDIIGEIVEKTLCDREVRLADPSDDVARCRTAVLAANSANVDAPPHVFRSYTTKQPAPPFTIHEVARATVHNAGFFPPVIMGSPPFGLIDAGLTGYNNPAEVGLAEAAALWPGTRTKCLVSLGTGLQKVVSVGEGWSEIAKACTAIAQGCEQVHDRVFRRRRHESLEVFRFNVDRGLDDISVTEWSEAGSQGHLTGRTSAYLGFATVEEHLDQCVRALNGEDPLRASNTNHIQTTEQKVVGYGKTMRTTVTLRRDGTLVCDTFTNCGNWFHGLRGRVLTLILDENGCSIATQVFSCRTRGGLCDPFCPSSGQETFTEALSESIGRRAYALEIHQFEGKDFQGPRNRAINVVQGVKAVVGDLW